MYLTCPPKSTRVAAIGCNAGRETLKEERMRRFGLLLVLLAATAAYASTASADPSHNIQEPVTLSCDGQTVVINPGTVTNQSHQAFVVGSTSIYVINFLAFSDGTDTFVLVDTAPGLTGQGLVTCTGDVGGGFTLTARGFFTPSA
jgi:hypothetical protein